LDPEGKLFDMQTDPGQRTNVAARFPEVVERFTQERDKWTREVLRASRQPERPFTVGYKAFPRAELPARDGTPHGTIRRSAGAPNCSFFTHWTSTNDFVSWNLESATSGEQEVEVLYTCATTNVGVRLLAEFAGSRVSSLVTNAFDPPLQGAENDLYPRQSESYVKEFRSLKLGKLKTPQGAGTLTLRATEIPGREAIDLRAVVLTLVK
jgi:hypothetical protein